MLFRTVAFLVILNLILVEGECQKDVKLNIYPNVDTLFTNVNYKFQIPGISSQDSLCFVWIGYDSISGKSSRTSVRELYDVLYLDTREILLYYNELYTGTVYFDNLSKVRLEIRKNEPSLNPVNWPNRDSSSLKSEIIFSKSFVVSSRFRARSFKGTEITD